jgi:hypothetical protein
MDGTQQILASADPVTPTPDEPEQVGGRFLLAVALLVVLPILIVLPAAYVPSFPPQRPCYGSARDGGV